MDGLRSEGFVGEVVLLVMGMIAAAFSVVVRGTWVALPAHRLFLASACASLVAWAFGVLEEFAPTPRAYVFLDATERACLTASAALFFVWTLRIPPRRPPR